MKRVRSDIYNQMSYSQRPPSEPHIVDAKEKLLAGEMPFSDSIGVDLLTAGVPATPDAIKAARIGMAFMLCHIAKRCSVDIRERQFMDAVINQQQPGEGS